MRLRLFILVVLLSGTIPAQTEPAEKIASLTLAANVFLIRTDGKIGNPNSVALLGKDGVVLVDSGFSSSAERLRDTLRKLGGSNIAFIINTHWHGDHTAGNEVLGAGSPVFSRRNIRKRLLTQGILEDNGRLIKPEGLPTVTYENPVTLYANGEEISIIPLPAGHTDGDSIIYLRKAGVLCVGDYLFLNRFPVIDTEGSGANLDGYAANIKYILKNFPADTKIAPGHSGFAPEPLRSANMSDLRDYLAMIEDSISHVNQQIASGLSLAEIQAEGLPLKFAAFTGRPRFVSMEAWIETVYINEKSKAMRASGGKKRNAGKN